MQTVLVSYTNPDEKKKVMLRTMVMSQNNDLYADWTI